MAPPIYVTVFLLWDLAFLDFYLNGADALEQFEFIIATPLFPLIFLVPTLWNPGWMFFFALSVAARSVCPQFKWRDIMWELFIISACVAIPWGLRGGPFKWEFILMIGFAFWCIIHKHKLLVASEGHVPNNIVKENVLVKGASIVAQTE